MNYVIEDNLDFYDLLNQSSVKTNIDTSNNCLITYEILTENSITLECNHSFNYLPLYQEIFNQKKNFNKYFDINKLKINEIKCPYCRKTNDKLIPFIPYKNVKKNSGVNYPEKLCMKNKHSCSWIFKNGKNKGCLCNVNSYILEGNNYCYKHHTAYKKNINKTQHIQTNDNWNNSFDEYYKKYKAYQLKEILRENKLILSGNKKQLIVRIVQNNIKL